MDTKRSYSKTDIKDVKLADEYGVNPLDYVDISLINIGLSIGAINNLMKEGVHTVCDLLNLTENELYGIKNIGKRSIEIIREALEDIFKSDRKALVRRSFDIIVDGKKKTNKMHRREKSALEKYKDAALIAGYEISKEAYINPDKVIPIMNALSGYSDDVTSMEERKKELVLNFEKIPKERHHLEIYPFIEAYSGEPEYKRVLKEIFYKKDRIIDIITKENIDDEHFYELAKFVVWLCFDISEICSSYLDDFLNDETSRKIINMRVKGKPLKTICEKAEVESPRIYALEKSLLKNLRALLSRHNLVKMIVALNGGNGIVEDETLDNHFGKYKEIILHYLKKINRNAISHDNSFDVYCLDAESTQLLLSIMDTFPKEIEEEELEEIIIDVAGRTGVSEEMLVRMVSNRYQKTGNIYHMGKLSNLAAFSYILKKYYPEGIRINCSEELDEFYDKAKELYGKDNLPKNKRVLANAVAKVGIHSYRGVYIHKDYVSYPKSVVYRIDEYIKGLDRNEISAYELYIEFYEVLVKETNIKNHYMLFSILRYELENQYLFKRNFVIAKLKLM